MDGPGRWTMFGGPEPCGGLRGWTMVGGAGPGRWVVLGEYGGGGLGLPGGYDGWKGGPFSMSRPRSVEP